MTKQQQIDAYIKAKQLLTFDEWYALNETAFTLGKNKNNPKELYEEYVAEVLGK